MLLAALGKWCRVIFSLEWGSSIKGDNLKQVYPATGAGLEDYELLGLLFLGSSDAGGGELSPSLVCTLKKREWVARRWLRCSKSLH